MFICDECLKKSFENDNSFSKSNGPCEVCGQKAVCNSIPSSELRPRRDLASDLWKSEVEDTRRALYGMPLRLDGGLSKLAKTFWELFVRVGQCYGDMPRSVQKLHDKALEAIAKDRSMAGDGIGWPEEMYDG
jgi:hypothetical protein